jgi:hypothetical protein
MTKQILFWTGIFTAISFWLTGLFLTESGPISELALCLSVLNILVFAVGVWALISKRFEKSTRGLRVGFIGPALVSTIVLGTAQFAPDNLDLTLIIVSHLFLIVAGNYVTTSSSWLTGIPTFWNTKSSALWGKSQRFFGYGTIIFGTVSLVVSLMSGAVNVPLAYGGIIGLIILGNIHSWWIWTQSQQQAEG